MPSRIEIIGNGNRIIGHFDTHLSADESVACIEAEGLGAFADWSGEFVPATPSEWTQDDTGWLLNGEPFYRVAETLGNVIDIPVD